MKQGELYYAGTITEVLDTVLYEIKADIPGIAEGIKAYPMRGEIDEPRVGDFVMLKCLDPTFQSYYLYQKIKENDFIGFRSNGKMVDITPDYIQLAIFDSGTEYNDAEGYRPEPTNWIKLDSEGNIDINLTTNSTIKIAGDSTVEVSGNSTVTISGDSNVTVSGSTTLNCPDVTITGGNVTMRGTANTDMQGPFNCIPTCPFSGAPHRGSQVSGT